MDGIRTLRILFLSLLGAPLLILAVLTVVIDELGSPSPGVALAAVAAGTAGMAGAWWASRRPVGGEGPAAVATAYRTNFFLGFALGEAGLLLTFVFCFIEGELWPFLVGLPCFAVAMTFVAPTERNFGRRQRDLMSAGSPVSLRDALKETRGR